MSKKPQRTPWLRQVNNGLSVIVVVLCLYIIVTPLLPAFNFWLKTHFGSDPPLVQANSGEQDDSNNPPEVIPEENTLVIPKLAMQEIIHEGESATTLRKGVWHRPLTSSPDQSSNTVLVGHRFTYDGPAIFYNLDKVVEGDDIIVYWQHQKYVYMVTRVFVVPPNAIEIEAPSDEPMLTVYTCTPLFTAKNRLIIQAKPTSETP